MDDYQRLIEGLPERTVSGRSSRLRDLEARTAITRLPLTNLERCAREVEHMLDHMLTIDLPGRGRITTLEQLRVPVTTLCAGVSRRIGTESYPLPQTSTTLVAIAQRIQLKLNSAYALGLHELCAPAGKLPRFRGTLAAEATTHGLMHAEQALLWSYRQYRTAPPRLWQRIHALYTFASRIGVQDRVTRDSSRGGVPGTPRDIYTGIILFVISNPLRFSARQQEKALQVARCIANLCVLNGTGTGGIAVDISTDAGPRYIVEQRLRVGPAMMTVDMTQADRTLDGCMAAVRDDVESVVLPEPHGGGITVSTGLLRRLRSGWSNAERASARVAAGYALDVVFGMNALHYSLAGDLDFAAFVRRVHGDTITVGRRHQPATWLAASDTARPPVFRVAVLDQSRGGYRIRLSLADGLRVRTGELIGLAPVVDEEYGWMVGVIRWLRHEVESVVLGIELLCREANAACLREVTTEGDVLAPRRAVEFPDGNNQGQMSLLLTDPLARNASSVDVGTPPRTADSGLPPVISRRRPIKIDALSSSCFRVGLALDDGPHQG